MLREVAETRAVCRWTHLRDAPPSRHRETIPAR